ncbi:MAG: hypothetical protein ABIS27_13215 [Longimicrobiales bacterium]
MKTRFYATFALAALTAFSASTAAAQTRGGKAGARAQGAAGGGRAGAQGAAQRDPIEMMIRAKQQLGLTDAQEASLMQIRQNLATQNAPLAQQIEQLTGRDIGRDSTQARDSVRAERTPAAAGQGRVRAQRGGARGGARGARGVRGQGGRQQPDSARAGARGAGGQVNEETRAKVQPIVVEIQRNTKQALTEARGVLTPEQLRKLRTVVGVARSPKTP